MTDAERLQMETVLLELETFSLGQFTFGGCMGVGAIDFSFFSLQFSEL